VIASGQHPPPIATGLYQHHKGGLYIITGTRWHSETLEPMVDYKVAGSNVPWSRPLVMFFDNVNVDGERVPRWQFIRPLSGEEMLQHAQALIALGDVAGAIDQLTEHARRFPTTESDPSPGGD